MKSLNSKPVYSIFPGGFKDAKQDFSIVKFQQLATLHTPVSCRTQSNKVKVALLLVSISR